MIGLEHPGILVSDLEKSIKFYEKIGFKILRKTSRPHAMMYLGDAILEIMPGLQPEQSYPFHLALYTDDIEGEVKRLHLLGIETSDIMTFKGETLEKLLDGVVECADPVPENPKLSGCMKPSERWKRVAFKDPDGIHIELWQRN
ncbi:MAG: VOC family protein [Candidatus Bathyarchaeota archaeon]|nr:VOC family protein [Candidatus Bathyarchaeota archaeon]